MKIFGAEKYLAPIVSGTFDSIFNLGVIAFGKRKVYYSCPNCKSDIRFPQEKCSNCGVELNWNENLEWKN